MTTPYPFSSGQTLLASQMNALSELPVVSITSSSTAVATDSYSRVIANGSAITYTLPNNVFTAGQIIEFHNINSTLATVAAGAGVTLNATRAATIEQYQSATIYATSASSFILFQSLVRPGAELVSSTTIGSAVTSVALSNVFSSTYTNYRIIISGGSASATSDGNFILGATATGYYASFIYSGWPSTGATAVNSSNIVNSGTVFAYSANGYNLDLTMFSPNVAARTSWIYQSSTMATSGNRWAGGGFVNDATQYTGLTFQTQSSHTLTGGTIKIYGLRD